MTGQRAALRLNSQLAVNRATQPLPAPEAPLVTNNPKNYRRLDELRLVSMAAT
jgi:hypothetical protein